MACRETCLAVAGVRWAGCRPAAAGGWALKVQMRRGKVARNTGLGRWDVCWRGARFEERTGINVEQ